MALTLKRANRILEKIVWSMGGEEFEAPQIRKANRFEGHGWVIHQGQHQALITYATMNLASAALMEKFFPFDTSKLTTKELDELRAIPSQVSRHLEVREVESRTLNDQTMEIARLRNREVEAQELLEIWFNLASNVVGAPKQETLDWLAECGPAPEEES
jgi:hypothetical protein